MSEDTSEAIEWNPFLYVEEDREVLERLAAQRHETVEFPAHLLTSDPAKIREIIQRSRGEIVVKDYSVPEPEILARPAEPGEWPSAAKSLVKKLDPSWRYRGDFMRGPVISSQNRERTIRSCFVLKAESDACRIRVVFYLKEDGKWERRSNWMFTPNGQANWTEAASVKALEAYCSPPS